MKIVSKIMKVVAAILAGGVTAFALAVAMVRCMDSFAFQRYRLRNSWWASIKTAIGMEVYDTKRYMEDLIRNLKFA